jgi:hypothetical protein
MINLLVVVLRIRVIFVKTVTVTACPATIVTLSVLPEQFHLPVEAVDQFPLPALVMVGSCIRKELLIKETELIMTWY